jgi:hypothetical protein
MSYLIYRYLYIKERKLNRVGKNTYSHQPRPHTADSLPHPQNNHQFKERCSIINTVPPPCLTGNSHSSSIPLMATLQKVLRL